MVTCVVFGCTNRSDCDAKSKGITFHVFPKNESRKALWENAVRRKNWRASKWSTICSQHFREEDIDLTSLSTLRVRENAVPSVFPTHPKHLRKGDKKRKPPLRKESSSFPSSVLATVSRVQDEEVPALVPEYTAGPPEHSQTSFESEELKTKCEHLIRKTDQYKKQIKTLQQSKRRLKKKVANTSERWQLLCTENSAATTNDDHDYFATGIYLSEVAVHIVVYIAGFVVRHLEKTLRGDGSHVAYSLIHRKSRGWLVLPSNDVVDICVCVQKKCSGAILQVILKFL
ncbi:THAP domain-containing protein 1-like [Schistocerca serialis cubense]|uniref:THAP domain-containing protein 1-like n=1 Tax=Schistocerca serialis cubense TaxID=2023355 RepID=UPI00214E92A0|nr:THAP domain-containing protein 1-like [Schistocerca serialis cubense]